MKLDIIPKILEEAVENISQFPGYGEKSAKHFILNLLHMPRGEAFSVLKNLYDVLDKIHPCKECGLYTDKELCDVCSAEDRDKETICVVEESFDAYAIENTGKYKGLYHVLGGRLSPLEGITPDQLNIDSLLQRIEKQPVKEVILATNPTVEGEATATYIYNLLKDKNITVSRIAYGLPFGATLENADDFTIAKALEHKTKF
ncbi:MAG: recombination protein RecR [Aquificae bacterium]|nr:recombination protein RecR [Aquificota bacterium]